MKKILVLLTALMFTFTLVGCSSTETKKDEPKEQTTTQESKENKESVELNISAAASLKDALEEINVNYEKETGNKVILNLAGSGKLVQQILEGAPADLFISASNAKMKDLVEKGNVEESAVSTLLENDLVMIVPKDSQEKVEKIEDLENVDGKIAIGEVETVPAGQYAKDSLTSLGLWDKIQDKIVYAKDVRAVLSYVEQGEVVAGFVYNSDATVAENSQIAQVVPADSHKPIVYPIAVLKESPNAEVAKSYEDFLKTEESTKIFEKFGFKVPTK